MQLWFGREKPVAYNSQSDAVDQGLFVWEMGYRLYGLFEAIFWCSSQVLRELIQQKQKFEMLFWRTPQESAGFKFKTTYLKNQKNVQYIEWSLDSKQIHLKFFRGLQSALLPKSPVSTSKAVLSSMVSMF